MIDDVAKRVVTAVARKIGGANLRNDAAASKQDLSRLHRHRVGSLSLAAVRERHHAAAAGGCVRLGSAAMIHKNVRIRVAERTRCIDPRQNAGAHFDVEPLGALDLLARATNVRVSLQRS